jgi:Flp pilus assembly protein TadD
VLTDSVTDSVVRGITLGVLLILAACTPQGLGSDSQAIEAANAALRGGFPETALQIASSLATKDPKNEAALLTQAEALAALGKPNEAATSFQMALTLNPQSVGAYTGLGRLRLRSDPAGAEALFLKALSFEPRNAVALTDLGVARDRQRRHAEAQTAYRQALAVSPDMTAAQVNLALSLAMSGRSKDAVRLLRPLVNAPGATAQLRYYLAAVLTISGEKAEAERILRRDLPASEVQQAVNAYASARPSAAVSLLAIGPAPAEMSASRPMRAATSGVLVQLAGPTPSPEAAVVKWQRLKRQMPDLLDGREPSVVEVTVSGEPVWRVRTGGFSNEAEAATFCQHVRSTGTSCTLVP